MRAASLKEAAKKIRLRECRDIAQSPGSIPAPMLASSLCGHDWRQRGKQPDPESDLEEISMMEDFDIPLLRAPVAETPIASGGGIYAKIYRHSRSDFEALSIDNHEVVLVLQGCGVARRTLSHGRKQTFRFRPGLIAVTPAGETQQLSLSEESLAIHFYVTPSRLTSVVGHKFDPFPAFGARDEALSSLGRLPERARRQQSRGRGRRRFAARNRRDRSAPP